jgi:hypothetical protein
MLVPEFNKRPGKRKLPLPELSIKNFKESPEVAKKNYEMANNLLADALEGNQFLFEENQKLRLDIHEVVRKNDLLEKDIEFSKSQERTRSGLVTLLAVLSIGGGALISLGTGFIPIPIDASLGKVFFAVGIIMEVLAALLLPLTKSRRDSK